MSVSVNNRAGVHFRTKLQPQHRALSFAAALDANAKFRDVEVVESRQAKGDLRFFVRFRPVSEARCEVIRAQQQQSRDERALAQGSDYLWCPDKVGGRVFVWCLSTSGEVYEVTPGVSCTCADFEYRCAGSGLDCKHLIALSLGLGSLTEMDLRPAPRDDDDTPPHPVDEVWERFERDR